MYFLDLIKDTVAKHIASLTDIDDIQNNFDESHSELEYTTEGTNNQTTMCNNDLCASTFYNYTPEDETAQGTFLNDEVITIDDTDRLLENCTMEDLEEKLLNKHLNKIYEEYSQGIDRNKSTGLSDTIALRFHSQRGCVNEIITNNTSVAFELRGDDGSDDENGAYYGSNNKKPRSRCTFTLDKCLSSSWAFIGMRLMLFMIIIYYSIGLLLSFACMYDFQMLLQQYPNSSRLKGAQELVKYNAIALFIGFYLAHRYPMFGQFIFIVTAWTIMVNSATIFTISVLFRVCKVIHSTIEMLRPSEIKFYQIRIYDRMIIKFIAFIKDLSWIKRCEGIIYEAKEYIEGQKNLP